MAKVFSTDGLCCLQAVSTMNGTRLANDFAKTGGDNRGPAFAGHEWTKPWEAGAKPDVVIVYNDHVPCYRVLDSLDSQF